MKRGMYPASLVSPLAPTRTCGGHVAHVDIIDKKKVVYPVATYASISLKIKKLSPDANYVQT